MTTAAVVPRKRAMRRAWPSVLHRVVKTARSRGLFEQGQHLLVAVSGGRDSIALLSLLHRLRPSWGLTLTAVHCNYGLRGRESNDDQQFVEEVCRRLEIPLHTRRLDVRTRPRGTSVQAAARDLRYRVLMDIAQRCGAERIAVGHTADDQAETVLLWMLRGAGLAGLSGMPAGRNGIIIRPLYDTRRSELLAYLHEEGWPFREDSTNSKPLYLRNRIRQEIVPALQQVMPSAVDALCRLAEICREDDRCLEEHVRELCEPWIRPLPEGGQAIDRPFLNRLPPAAQRRVLRRLLTQCDVQHRPPSLRTVDRLLEMVGGANRGSGVVIPAARVMVERDEVRVVPQTGRQSPPERSFEADSMVLTVPGHVIWTGTGQQIRVQLLAREYVRGLALDRNRIVVDAGLVSDPLVVRAWKPGDRLYPRGMNGRSKKLQDLFTDLKVSGAHRRRMPLIVAPEGIVWVVGCRQDGRWSMNERTQQCLVLTVQDQPSMKGS